MAKYKLKSFIKEDVNPYKISNRLFDHTARTANVGSTGEELHFNIIEITPETFTIEYRITANSPNRPIGASRNYRSEPKEGVADIQKDFKNPKNIQVRGTNFTVQSGEFMDQVYGDAASVAEGEFEFRPTETDAPGMQARPDGYLKDKVKEHHNDPNFPGGTKIHALLDKVAEDWGKDSDLYSDLEDAIVGWSNRYGELSPKGILAIKALLSNWDSLEDYEHFLTNDEPHDPIAKANAEYQSPSDRMYNSDAWVQAQRDMNEELDYHHLLKVRAGIIK